MPEMPRPKRAGFSTSWTALSIPSALSPVMTTVGGASPASQTVVKSELHNDRFSIVNRA